MTTIYDTTILLLQRIEKLQTQLKQEQDKNNKLLSYIESMKNLYEKPKLIRSTNEECIFDIQKNNIICELEV